MLDLGTSFLASVARDPEALAIVDGHVRLSYRAWYTTISALVAAFDEIGLASGDHLVTVLQNRWEAATIHWACQFAGIIITPLNWRSTAEELDFCVDDSEAKAIVYEEISAAAVRSSRQGHARACIEIKPLCSGDRWVKLERAHGGCLGIRSRRRTWLPTKRFGELETSFDPEISEWGNPARVMSCDSRLNT